MKILVYLMPITFLFILNDFPAGLTFYYFVSNLATLAQQELIKRFVDEDSIREKLAANVALHGEKSRFQSRMQAAIRAKK
jgi:YidC/Oxa1 family membrane protein insertase